MDIIFGAMAAPLHEQLDIASDLLALEQRLADAIVLCSVHSILTSHQSSSARKRLVKRISRIYGESQMLQESERD